jgi:LPS-assembly lipoprotein
MSGRRASGLALAVMTSLLLASCGLQPIYGGGARSSAAQALAGIEVAPIPDRAGFLVRSALQDRLGGVPAGAARYRLEVELDDAIEGFGIRGDDSITRERRTLRARYRLISADGARTFLDATARSDVGIDVVRSSDFAVIAAENSALERLATELAEQIGTRLALLARTTPELQAAAPAR